MTSESTVIAGNVKSSLILLSILQHAQFKQQLREYTHHFNLLDNANIKSNTQYIYWWSYIYIYFKCFIFILNGSLRRVVLPLNLFMYISLHTSFREPMLRISYTVAYLGLFTIIRRGLVWLFYFFTIMPSVLIINMIYRRENTVKFMSIIRFF